MTTVQKVTHHNIVSNIIMSLLLVNKYSLIIDYLKMYLHVCY